MPQRLSLTALLVRDYDEAIRFFVDKLGFELREDTRLSSEKRWVVVGPPGAGHGLFLARAVGERQRRAIGDLGGGRVFLFLETDNLARDHAAYMRRGVRFTDSPRQERNGMVAVFEDLYGNRWDLIQPARADPARPRTIRILAALIDDGLGRLLLVRKAGTRWFMQPGGKIEPGEDALEALQRELNEEIGLFLPDRDFRHLGRFSTPAANEPDHVVDAEVFHLRMHHVPVVRSEIEETVWVSHVDAASMPLAPLTRDHILPLSRML